MVWGRQGLAVSSARSLLLIVLNNTNKNAARLVTAPPEAGGCGGEVPAARWDLLRCVPHQQSNHRCPRACNIDRPVLAGGTRGSNERAGGSLPTLERAALKPVSCVRDPSASVAFAEQTALRDSKLYLWH